MSQASRRVKEEAGSLPQKKRGMHDDKCILRTVILRPEQVNSAMVKNFLAIMACRLSGQYRRTSGQRHSPFVIIKKAFK